MSGGRPAFRYVAVEDLHGAPHVLVDGAPRLGTLCTLSHWPRTPTDPALWADTSAEIVLRALHTPGALPAGTDIASIDHVDADGVLALASLVVDGLAETHGDLVVRAACAGDFDVVLDRDAGRVAFALPAMRGSGVPFMLEALPALLATPGDFGQWWGPEDAAFDAALSMRAEDAVSIEEHPARDLAVVRVDLGHRAASAAAWADSVVHPAAVSSGTPCLRIATVAGRHYEVRFRYESWVRLGSRRPRPRVDLSGLAVALQAMESDGGAWQFDGAGALTPRLRRADGSESTFAPGQFLDALCRELDERDAGPAAWDPYAVRP